MIADLSVQPNDKIRNHLVAKPVYVRIIYVY